MALLTWVLPSSSTSLLQVDGDNREEGPGRIYIGNMPFSATEADVRELLKDYEVYVKICAHCYNVH